jgi:hypothetical protein
VNIIVGRGMKRRQWIAAKDGNSGWQATCNGLRGPLKRMTVAETEDIRMLMTIVVLLLVLWLLGMITQYTLGGILHILLVVAVIVLLIRVIRGRPI